jgi:hypothetical protein
MVTVNWTELRKNADMSGGFTNLKAGETYNLEVVKGKAQMTQAGDKEQLNLLLKSEDGPSKGATGFKTMTLTTDNAKALGIWFQELAVLGFDDAFFAANPSITVEQLASLMVGHRCVGDVSERKYEGKTYTDIKIQPPLNGFQPALPSGPLPVSAAMGVPTPDMAANLAVFTPTGDVPPAPDLPF